jgi:hypothetical protein
MKNIALLFVSIVAALLFSEGVVRVFHLCPRIINNIGCIRFTNNYKTVYEFIPGTNIDGSIINKQGFKDDDFTLEKPANVVRIAMLGDSIAQGLYIPKEKAFSSLLKRLLNERAAIIGSPTRYEVMNFSVGGYNLEAEIELFHTKVLPYHPDIVVLNYFCNDNDPMPGIHLWFVSSQTGVGEEDKLLIFQKYCQGKNPINEFFRKNVLSKSQLYLFLTLRLGDLHNKIFTLNKFANRQLGILVMDKTDIANARRELEEVKKLQQTNKFKFLVCIHPLICGPEHPNDRIFAGLLKEFNFPYFNMRDQYLAASKDIADFGRRSDEKGAYCDSHLNELGHKIAAAGILHGLQKAGFLDQRL